jgi:hypothetical protein
MGLLQAVKDGRPSVSFSQPVMVLKTSSTSPAANPKGFHITSRRIEIL